MSPPDVRPPLLRDLWRRLRAPLILLLLYLGIEQLFVTMVVNDGLFLPLITGEGIGALVSGAVVLLLRVAAYLLLPMVLSYKLAMFAWQRWLNPEER